MKITTIDEFLTHKVAPEHRAIVSKLRALMKQHAPGAKEGINYSILAWKMKRMIAVVNATKHHIKFAFSGGAHFEDKYRLAGGRRQGLQARQADEPGRHQRRGAAVLHQAGCRVRDRWPKIAARAASRLAPAGHRSIPSGLAAR